MGARSGEQYRESLRANQPVVFLNGERVEDVTAHPAFRGPLRTIMEQYDLQLAEANRDVCLFASPKTGESVSSSFLMPRSRDDLAKRRRHFKLRADHNFGLMGRAPDFMNAYVTGWGFAAGYYGKFKPEYGNNARSYYEPVRDNDLFVTHVLVNPQIDRSKTSANQEEPYFHLGRVRATPDGLIVRGAKMLATMAPLCEELLVAPYGGVAQGDDAYALAFAIPTKTAGLKFICREAISAASARISTIP
jgi:aromatic ring hydroxylase